MKWRMKWSENAQTWMELMGEFTPTDDNKFVVGLAYDFENGGLYTVHRDADCLRRIAAACLEVAEGLEE